MKKSEEIIQNAELYKRHFDAITESLDRLHGLERKLAETLRLHAALLREKQKPFWKKKLF